MIKRFFVIGLGSLYNKESKVSVDLINGNENREDIADDMISVPDVNEAEFKYNKIRVSIADAYLKGELSHELC